MMIVSVGRACGLCGGDDFDMLSAVFTGSSDHADCDLSDLSDSIETRSRPPCANGDDYWMLGHSLDEARNQTYRHLPPCRSGGYDVQPGFAAESGQASHEDALCLAAVGLGAGPNQDEAWGVQPGSAAESGQASRKDALCLAAVGLGVGTNIAQVSSAQPEFGADSSRALRTDILHLVTMLSADALGLLIALSIITSCLPPPCS